jgi:hypothetical protein
MNEFSRLFRLDSLSSEPSGVHVEAEPAEREALARRFGLVAVEALAGDAELRRERHRRRPVAGSGEAELRRHRRAGRGGD